MTTACLGLKVKVKGQIAVGATLSEVSSSFHHMLSDAVNVAAGGGSLM